MKKFENFCKALSNLHEIHRYEPPYTDPIIVAGMTALYTICFEQAWRAMKEYLDEEGWAEAESGSPRQIIKTAYQAGVITDEEGWLQALLACNLQSHTYNEKVAQQLIEDTKACFLPLFDMLREKLARRGE